MVFPGQDWGGGSGELYQVIGGPLSVWGGLSPCLCPPHDYPPSPASHRHSLVLAALPWPSKAISNEVHMLVRCWGLLACLDWRLAIGYAHCFQITQHLRLDFTNHYQGRIAFHGLNSVSRNHARGCGSPSWTQGYCHFSLGCPRADSLTDI